MSPSQQLPGRSRGLSTRSYELAVERGLELVAASKLDEALPFLQEAAAFAATAPENPDRVGEVYFSLGRIANELSEEAEDGDQVHSGSSVPEQRPTGGAFSREDVLGQIKEARLAARREKIARRKRARGRGGAEGGEEGEQEAEAEEEDSAFQPFQDMDEHQKSAAFFFALAAQQGHIGAMVGLGNLHLSAAEALAAMAAEDEESVTTRHFSESTSQGPGNITVHSAVPTPLDPEQSPHRRMQRSMEEAVRWYKDAAIQGHPDALFNLGQVFYAGRGGLAPDPAAGTTYFRAAAEAGDAAAHFWLAHSHRVGDAEVRLSSSHSSCCPARSLPHNLTPLSSLLSLPPPSSRYSLYGRRA